AGKDIRVGISIDDVGKRAACEIFDTVHACNMDGTELGEPANIIGVGRAVGQGSSLVNRKRDDLAIRQNQLRRRGYRRDGDAKWGKEEASRIAQCLFHAAVERVVSTGVD